VFAHALELVKRHNIADVTDAVKYITFVANQPFDEQAQKAAQSILPQAIEKLNKLKLNFRNECIELEFKKAVELFKENNLRAALNKFCYLFFKQDLIENIKTKSYDYICCICERENDLFEFFFNFVSLT
jgi:hypothetical protein